MYNAYKGLFLGLSLGNNLRLQASHICCLGSNPLIPKCTNPMTNSLSNPNPNPNSECFAIAQFRMAHFGTDPVNARLMPNQVSQY